MKKFPILAALVFVAGCATTQIGDYAKDTTKGIETAGAFVGTSATQENAAIIRECETCNWPAY